MVNIYSKFISRDIYNIFDEFLRYCVNHLHLTWYNSPSLPHSAGTIDGNKSLNPLETLHKMGHIHDIPKALIPNISNRVDNPSCIPSPTDNKILALHAVESNFPQNIQTRIKKVVENKNG